MADILDTQQKMQKRQFIAHLVDEPADNRSFVEILADLKVADPDKFERVVEELVEKRGEAWMRNIKHQWEANARPKQLPPEPLDAWRVWCVLAGRGFGKTRCGAETVRRYVDEGRAKRIALVGATTSDVNKVMLWGDSGLMNIYPEKERPHYSPTNRRVIWKNPDGTEKAVAEFYTAEEADRLRGPQHDFAWCDEIVAWRYQETWDMLMFGLRLGDNPQCIVTTTPKPLPILLDILKLPTTYTTRGTTYENRSNLAKSFFTDIITKYEHTSLGRQELEAEILEDIPNALWNYDLIEATRVKSMRDVPDLLYVVLAVDPATTSGTKSAETGMCVAGYGVDDKFYILYLNSFKLSPEDWAKKAIELFEEFECDKMVAEVNNGGDLVQAVIKSVKSTQQVFAVHASRGKATRAEPISALYSQGRVRHVGHFARGEEQMVRFNPIENPYEDKDMVDAVVWAVTWLHDMTQGASRSKPVTGGVRSKLTGYNKLFGGF